MDSSAISSRLIGSFIVEKGLITEEQLELALDEQQTSGRLLGEILVARKSEDEVDITVVPPAPPEALAVGAAPDAPPAEVD